MKISRATLMQLAAEHLPMKRCILDYAAVLPPGLRTRLWHRAINAIVFRMNDRPDVVTSNLGIHRSLRCLISPTNPLAFGTPLLIDNEIGSMRLLRELLRYSDCLLDVGANAGMYSFYMRVKNARLPIFCFEPDTKLFRLLRSNIERNKLDIECLPIAMDAKSGPVTFFENLTDSSSGTIVPEDWSKHDLRPIQVPAVSFADFVTRHNLANVCAKVDVEGAEDRFWIGCKPEIDRLSYLLIELLAPAIKRGLPSAIMRESKFNAYYVNNYRLTPIPPDDADNHGRALSLNWLFCRETAAELRGKLARSPFRVLK
jgi:FkbM family methyltransferase